MHSAAKTANSAVTRSIHPQRNHVWISDEVLAASFGRFAASCRSTTVCRRHGGNIPGPLEARRRLARRRLNNLSVGREVDLYPPPPAPSSAWNLNWLNKLLDTDAANAPVYQPPNPQIWSSTSSQIQMDNAEHVDRIASFPAPTAVADHPHSPTSLPLQEQDVSRHKDQAFLGPHRAHKRAAFLQTGHVRENPVLDDLHPRLQNLLSILETAAFPPNSQDISKGSDAKTRLANSLLLFPNLTTAAVVGDVSRWIASQHYCGSLGHFRQARILDTWLVTLRECAFIQPSTLELAMSIIASNDMVLADLPDFFATLSYDEVARLVARCWVPRRSNRQLRGPYKEQTDSLLAKLVRYQDLDTTLRPEALLEVVLSRPLPNGRYVSIQPLVDLLAIAVKSERVYRQLLEMMLDFLLRTGRAADFVDLVEVVHMSFRVPIPSSVIVRWVNANMEQHPDLVCRCLRYAHSPTFPLTRYPGLMKTLIDSPEVDPKKIHGLLVREEHQAEPTYRTIGGQRDALLRLAHEMARGFARTSRAHFTYRARKHNIVRLYNWLRKRGLPVQPSLADDLVLVSLLLPPLQGTTPTYVERELAIQVYTDVHGFAPTEEAHLATIHPDLRRIHLPRLMRKKYGLRWRKEINPLPGMRCPEEMEETIRTTT